MAKSNLEVSNAALYKIGAIAITALADNTKEAAVCSARVDIVKKALLRMHPWNFAIDRQQLSPTFTAITGAADNGSGLVRISTASTTGLSNGMRVTVVSVGGVTASTGSWVISGLVANTSFDLVATTFAGTYTSGGTWTRAAGFTYAYSIALPTDFIRVIRIDDDDAFPSWRIEGKRVLTDSYPVELRYVYNVTDYTEMDDLFYECLALLLAIDICPHLTEDENKKRSLWTDLNGGDGKVGLLPRGRFVDATEDSMQEVESNDWLASRFTSNNQIPGLWPNA